MKFSEEFETEYGRMAIHYMPPENVAPHVKDEVIIKFDIRGDKKRIDFMHTDEYLPTWETEDEQVEWWRQLALSYIEHNLYNPDGPDVEIFKWHPVVL